jgi:RNA polymerase sigma factor (sigma-70 family)
MRHEKRLFAETPRTWRTLYVAMADKELDELFRRFVREHDVRAVGELFDTAAPQLARIAWHLTHDASGVEDLVQTTFLTALASAHEFADERRVMPWLLRILLNHARNARRASERKPEPLAVDLVDPRTPESDLERRELHEVVQRAVADLPDTYREVVSTWLIEGATPTEIAHRTGKPAATVRV